MKAKKIFLFITLILLLGVGGYFGLQYYAKSQRAKQRRIVYEARKAAWKELHQRVKIEISQFKGEAGIEIIDLETGWEFPTRRRNCFPPQVWLKFLLWQHVF